VCARALSRKACAARRGASLVVRSRAARPGNVLTRDPSSSVPQVLRGGEEPRGAGQGSPFPASP